MRRYYHFFQHGLETSLRNFVNITFTSNQLIRILSCKTPRAKFSNLSFNLIISVGEVKFLLIVENFVIFAEFKSSLFFILNKKKRLISHTLIS